MKFHCYECPQDFDEMEVCHVCRCDCMEDTVRDFAVAAYEGKLPTYIRNVPTLECRQCGARAYSSAVCEQMDKARRLPPHFDRLEVRGFDFEALRASDGTQPSA